METQNITIQDINFTIPAPYSEGHVLVANEASALNQLFAENIRNNFAAKMKKAKEEGKSLTQADLDEYAAEYKFGVRSGSGPRLDPIESEAWNIAEAQVKKLLKAKGLKVKDAEESGKLKLWTTQLLDKYPEIRQQAQKIVEARSGAVADLSLD